MYNFGSSWYWFMLRYRLVEYRYWIIAVIAVAVALVVVKKRCRREFEDDSIRLDEERFTRFRNILNVVYILTPLVVAWAVLVVLSFFGTFGPMFSWNPIGLGIGAGGLLFTYIGVGFKISGEKKRMTYDGVCTGRVTEIVEREDNEGHTTYSPIVCYTVGEEEFEHSSSYSAGRKEIPQIDSEVTMYYDRKNPSKAQADWERKMDGTFFRWFVAFGVPMIIIGGFICLNLYTSYLYFWM